MAERDEFGRLKKGHGGLKPKGAKSKTSGENLNSKIDCILNYFKSFETNNEYYVYAHFNPITNECFYIGKGKGNRAWLKSTRNDYWKNYITLVPNYEIRLIVTGLNEDEAFSIEEVLIKSRNPICNIASVINRLKTGENEI